MGDFMFFSILPYLLYYLLLSFFVLAFIVVVAFLVCCAIMHDKPSDGLKLLFGKDLDDD